jgi:xylan 1,4-beta-xylosidase
VAEPLIFSADLGGTPIPLRQPWQWCVGSDHAVTALRADWQAQLRQAHADLGFRHVRFHGILDDAMGTVIEQGGQFIYSFFNTDRIFDFLLSIGMKPVIELSFMPRALASGDEIVFRYQGNITPPRDYAQWAELIRRLATHWIERYGIDEVAQWPFECWNEPNLSYFSTRDQAEYFRLYRSTAAALKAVHPRLQVGGPATAANEWIEDFIVHGRNTGTPVDFISTHYYPTDPFGTAQMDTTTQLEHTTAGVMRLVAQQARDHAGKLPLYYTEWSISSNPRDPFHDSAFAAALAARIAMSVDDLVDGYSWWTFSDIFEENYFPSVPFHGGFGLLNLYGIPKPVYRAFQMLRLLGSERCEVSGEHPRVAVWAARHDGNRRQPANLVLINQAMPRHAIDNEPLSLRLRHHGALRARRVSVFRVDEEHANPVRAWYQMGTPEYLLPAQVATLLQVSQPQPEPLPHRYADGTLEIDLVLAPQSINRVQIDWG